MRHELGLLDEQLAIAVDELGTVEKPAPDGLEHRRAGRDLLVDAADQLGRVGEDDLGLRLEIPEERPRRDHRRLGDLLDRHLVEAPLLEQVERRLLEGDPRLVLLALTQAVGIHSVSILTNMAVAVNWQE